MKPNRTNKEVVTYSHLFFQIPRWLSPLSLLSVITPITLLLLLSTPETYWLDIWRTPKFFTSEDVVIALLVLVLLALGMSWNTFKSIASKVEFSDSAISRISRLASILTFASILFHLLWIGLATAKGLSLSTVVGVFRGDTGALLSTKYLYFQKISGVTSWVQLSIPACFFLILKNKLRPNPKFVWSAITVLILLAAARAVMLAERIAILEIVAVVVATSVIIKRTESPQNPFNQVKFFASIWLGLPVFYGLFEFTRSWSSYYSAVETDYGTFVLSRLLGYYSTSFNNAALALHNLTWDQNLGVLFRYNFADNNIGETLLRGQSNYEFNNFSTLLMPVACFGLAAGLVFAFMLGFFYSKSASMSSRGSLTATLTYVCTLIGILEMPRFFYLGDGRVIPVLIAALASHFYLRKSV